MSGHLLTPDEIDALLQTGGKEASHPGLTKVLAFVAQNMIPPLGDLTAPGVKIEGPYVESLKHTLDQVITEEAYLVPVELGSGELFVFLSKTDSAVLEREWGLTPEEAVSVLSRIWMGELARTLGELKGARVQFKLFQVQALPLAALAQLPLEKDTVFVRHLLRWGEISLELCFLIQGSQTGKLVQQSEEQTRTWSTAPKSKPRTSLTRRVLKPAASPVTEATFLPLRSWDETPNNHPISLVKDIDLAVTVELGQVVLTINELLELKPETVISLERHVGEPVDVFINDNPVAKGEVVVLEQNFGVRVLEIVPKSERIQIEGGE